MDRKPHPQSWGFANLKSTTALWASPAANYEEDVKKDGVISADETVIAFRSIATNLVKGFTDGVFVRVR